MTEEAAIDNALGVKVIIGRADALVAMLKVYHQICRMDLANLQV